jgi:hypothetical protein
MLLNVSGFSVAPDRLAKIGEALALRIGGFGGIDELTQTGRGDLRYSLELLNDLPDVKQSPLQCQRIRQIVAKPVLVSVARFAWQDLNAVPEMVPLLRCLSSHFGGHRSVEGDSHKTCEFSTRKSCVEKRMRIRDEPSGGSHQSVVFRESEETVRFPGRGQEYRCWLTLKFIKSRQLDTN